MKKKSENPSESDFGNVIFSYTDDDAVMDGILGDITGLKVKFRDLPVNRITRTLWEDLQPFLIDHSKAEKALGIEMPTKMEQLTSILVAKLKLARNSSDDDYLYILPGNVWLVKNEVNGYTCMRPDDY